MVLFLGRPFRFEQLIAMVVKVAYVTLRVQDAHCLGFRV